MDNSHSLDLLRECGLQLPQEKYIGLYFTASWCRPCRQFTPKLIEIADDVDMIVAVVSCDMDSRPYSAFIQDHPQFYPVPFGHDVERRLKQMFKVYQLPTLIIVHPRGQVMTENGSEALQYFGSSQFPWNVKRCRELSEKVISDLNRKPALILLADYDGIEEKNSEELVESLYRIARRLDASFDERPKILRRLQIFYALQDNKLAKKLRTFCKIDPTECPVLLIVDFRKGLKFKAGKPEFPLNEIRMQRFIENYATGRLGMYYGSPEISLQAASPGMIVATPKSLPEFVADDSFTFALAYAGWCASSVEFLKQLRRVGQILDQIPRALDSISLVEFNIDQGEIDRVIFPERVLPIAKLFRPEALEQEETVVQGKAFTSIPSLLRILEFLQEETQSSVIDVDFHEAIEMIPYVQ